MDTNSLSHARWECQYHIVFIPKYRQKRLYGEIRADVKEIIKTLCAYKKVKIMEGAVCKDHIHLHVSIPPKLSIADFVGYLKGKSALMIYDKHPEQRSRYHKSFWARGYYVATIGTISEDTIKKYIQEQRSTYKNKARKIRRKNEDRKCKKAVCDTPFRGASTKAPDGAKIKPPLEVVVAEFMKGSSRKNPSATQRFQNG